MQFIKPDWPAPRNVHAYTTTRRDGRSLAAYASFNLAEHVGDQKEHVELNRSLLSEHLELPSTPIWLQQIHSNKVIAINNPAKEVPVADAAITSQQNMVCVVMTADCLPILICNKEGTKVGAIHAGWRGLAGGVIENAITEFNEPPEKLMAWFGPAIGPQAFEVSEDVRQPFVDHDAHASTAFIARPNLQNKWLANIYMLASIRLNALGLTAIYGGQHCTYTDQKNFYSYRRDGITGRMATLIWLSA